MVGLIAYMRKLSNDTSDEIENKNNDEIFNKILKERENDPSASPTQEGDEKYA